MGVQWGVVSTVSEPAALVVAFAAHALDRGAAEVHLFLDRPDPGLATALARLPRIRLTACDAAYWRRVPGGRPWPTAMRQRINLQRAYDDARLPWLFHIDADEFLWGPDLGAALSRVSDSADFASVEAVERVHSGAPGGGSIFDGVFRRACLSGLQAEVDRIDGAAAPFLDCGLASYVGGKSLFRTGRGLKADIHVPAGATEARMHRLTGHALLHYDGLTAWGWIAKKQRKIAQQPEWRSFPFAHRHTVNQLAAIHAAGPDRARLVDLYLSMKCLDARREAALRDLGLILDAAPGQAAALTRLAVTPLPDLTVEGYNTQRIAFRRRLDRQTVKHEFRALVSRWTGRPPRP